ncbi:ABC transporter ATP-binding protein [Candidatus Saccharibacteria bacterium]|nr:ABC transporter ATP-binding protein [Candidatus Saccharibacteria bacterium]
MAKKSKDEESKKVDLRVALRGVMYARKIYNKAAGKRRFLSMLERLYGAISPSILAVLGGTAVNQIVQAAQTGVIYPFLITIAVISGVQFVGIFLGRIVSLMDMEIRRDVFSEVTRQISLKYIEIPLEIRETKEFADRFERVQDFGSDVNQVISNTFSIASATISLISILITTLATSPIITLVIIISSIPYSVLSLKLSRKTQENWRKSSSFWRIAYGIGDKMTQSSSALEIKINNLQEYLCDKMIENRQRGSIENIKNFRKTFTVGNWMRFVETVVNFASLAFVALKIVAGELAIGQFATVRSLLQQLSGNITALFSSIGNANEGLMNAEDYLNYIQTPIPKNGDVVVEGTPTIEFKKVCFTYPHATEPALQDVSFVLKPGDSLAIVGENGAGKTTLMKLLLGAYTPSSGEILINGTPIKNIERSSYDRQLGVLLQEYTRFPFADFKDNIWYGDISKELDKERLGLAIKDAGLEKLVKTLPKGLDQVLSKDYFFENATDLSGGQWQRVCIARTFYRNPNVLLLDEPTSAVDAKAEYEIFKNILRRQKGKSTVIISHRFSTVRKANRIIVMDHGKMVEHGTHEELIAKDGLYKEMFTLQAEGYA